MKETEWLTCKDPQRMLVHLRRMTGGRKLRLFAVACCRRIEHILENESHRHTLEKAERLADGVPEAVDSPNAYSGMGVLGLDLAELEACAWTVRRPMTRDEQTAAIQAWHETPSDQWYPPGIHTVCEPTTETQRLTAHLAAVRGSESAARAAARAAGGDKLLRFGRTYGIERRAQADLLREIMGDPFRRVIVDPAWLTPRVIMLAQAAYAERAFDLLPILGDALEEAGCIDIAIPAHCRAPVEHVRGCWVVDVLLGKS
jgi:hypothetical protein